jgi:hypothetical protein
LGSDENPGNTGINQRRSTGTGAPLVTARFQRDIKIGATGKIASVTEGKHLRVRLSRRRVIPFTYNFAVSHQHGTDSRIGCSPAQAFLGQGDGSAHVCF